MIRIEKWGFGANPHYNDGYTAPEFGVMSVCGKVYGHPKFEDGNFVFTSTPTGWNEEHQTMTTASGSEYKLGDIDPEYESQFGPNAKEKFIEQLKKKNSSATKA